MKEISVALQDGTIRRYPQHTTIGDIAESIGAGLKKKAMAGRINGRLADLDRRLEEEGGAEIVTVDIVTLDSPDGLEILRHTAAHVLAQAVRRLYGPQSVKLGIGPVIADGFYYDIGLDRSLSPGDLAAVEREMEKVIQENLPVVRREVSREEALRIFEALGEPLKLELIRDLPQEAVISLYSQGEFTDLCRGPHLPSTGWIKAFKLLSVAGAYWRGDSNNPMLQRIYGTAFAKKAELGEHLRLLEEAKLRDHRKLGRELGLFMFSDEAPGMPFYLPAGMTIRTELEDFARELQRQRDYDEVKTPFMMNQRLWELSGHADHYRENMYYTDVDDTKYALKPMNCPGHMLIFKNRLYSYRDLPVRIAEFGQVHRHEFSGALNGMMRVRTFCQDDAHLFVRPDQIQEEIGKIIELIDRMYRVFGFSYVIELSTRPEDYMGAEELWNQAEASLQSVLDSRGIPYRLNPGDGAFYGPKIDFHILDALKRSWQCGTIQLDFQLPEKFELGYVAEDGHKHRPVVIHRAVYGSLDRFIGILTEHYAGAFPLWLAPVQVKLLPVSDPYNDYAYRVKELLAEEGIRAEVDARSEKLGYKIREAQLGKVPYMFILGEQELSSGTVSVRRRDSGDMGPQEVGEIAGRIVEEIRLRQ
ncbi:MULTISPECIES: threonine--tRNA ligase [Paenibacillus]|uniref:threonine--tRNA ligase n=1 Tax=Paenibacillus TaxID=44249 RepID=UPI0022B87FC9|nr:threonine--tRNA ligase [Paenibacillus caseinilyticus]MCZ8519811.1 threonine--tRNA ligase [Paenibacillus caseinilyticus]